LVDHNGEDEGVRIRISFRICICRHGLNLPGILPGGHIVYFEIVGVGFIALIVGIDFIEGDDTTIKGVEISAAKGHDDVAGMRIAAPIVANGKGQPEGTIRIDTLSAQASVIIHNIEQRSFGHLLHDVIWNIPCWINHIAIVGSPTPRNLGGRRRFGGRIDPPLGHGVALLVEDWQSYQSDQH